jgi:hypothetical protein
LGQIGGEAARSELARAAHSETDAGVIQEIKLAVSKLSLL